jgi:hypothetical protein
MKSYYLIEVVAKAGLTNYILCKLNSHVHCNINNAYLRQKKFDPQILNVATLNVILMF